MGLIKASSFEVGRVQSHIMNILKVRRDWCDWEYDSYYTDHTNLIGSKPMGYNEFQTYFGERLKARADSLSDKLSNDIITLIKN